jgi:hypothetical protein
VSWVNGWSACQFCRVSFLFFFFWLVVCYYYYDNEAPEFGGVIWLRWIDLVLSWVVVFFWIVVFGGLWFLVGGLGIKGPSDLPGIEPVLDRAHPRGFESSRTVVLL